MKKKKWICFTSLTRLQNAYQMIESIAHIICVLNNKVDHDNMKCEFVYAVAWISLASIKLYDQKLADFLYIKLASNLPIHFLWFHIYIHLSHTCLSTSVYSCWRSGQSFYITSTLMPPPGMPGLQDLLRVSVASITTILNLEWTRSKY